MSLDFFKQMYEALSNGVTNECFQTFRCGTILLRCILFVLIVL